MNARPKINESMPELRISEAQTAEPKIAEAEPAEPKIEPKISEAKAAERKNEPKTAEAKICDPKIAEPKIAARKIVVPRVFMPKLLIMAIVAPTGFELNESVREPRYMALLGLAVVPTVERTATMHARVVRRRARLWHRCHGGRSRAEHRGSKRSGAHWLSRGA